MSTRKFTMPKTPEIGKVGEDKILRLSEGYAKFFGGIEDVSGRVMDYDSAPTATTLRDALIAAGLMRSS